MAGETVTYKFVANDGMTFHVKAIAAATRKAKNEMRGFRGAMSGARSGINKLGKSQGLRRTGVIAAGVAAVSLKAFGDMEAGLKNVLTLLDNDEEILKWRGRLKQAQETAVKAGFGVADVNKALFDTVSALGGSEIALETWATSQKLAIAGVSPLADVTLGMAKVMSVYGDEIENTDDLANAMFTGQKKGQLTIAEMGRSIGVTTGMSKAAGIGFKDMIAFVSQLTQTLPNAAESVTAFNALIKGMTGPTGEAAKILAHFEIPINQVELAEIGMGEAMIRVNQLIAERPELLAKAFPNIRASKAINALTTKQMEKQAGIVQQINSDTKTGEGFSKSYTNQLKGFNQEMARSKGQATVFAAELGFVLAPAVRGIGSTFRDFATFIKINPEIGEFFQGLGDLASFAAGNATAKEAGVSRDSLSRLSGFGGGTGAAAWHGIRSKSTLDVNIKGQQGTAESVALRTEGSGMKVGVNAEEVLP